MLVRYEDLLEKVLTYCPDKIACDDAILLPHNRLKWELLDETYNKVELKLLEENVDGEFLDSLSWCVAVGVDNICKKTYQSNSNCKFIFLKDIDHDIIKNHFIETIEDEDWQEYLSENDMDIQF